MKKSIENTLVALVLILSITVSTAQIKNLKTETVKIYGNCGMCEKTIEKAGSVKKIAVVDWNKDTKMATLNYDSKVTNQDEILKRIALSGYESEKYLAPDKVYNELAGCCQYDRTAKTAPKPMADMKHQDHMEVNKKSDNQSKDQLKVIFDNYFAVKEALIKTDGAMASTKSAELLSAITAVKMEGLEMDVHTVWMKVLTNLKEDAQHIAITKDASHQRDYFITLSKNMYQLMKVSKSETPTYYQFCPMANNGKGANWLSKESQVKNPYYGSQMLSCGKTVETL